MLLRIEAENLHCTISCMVAEELSAALEAMHLYSPSSSSSKCSRFSVVPKLMIV